MQVYTITLQAQTAAFVQSMKDAQTSIKGVTDQINQMGAALKTHQNSLNQATNAHQSFAQAISANSSAALILLRALGPIGGAATQLASQIERAAVAADRMEESSKGMVGGMASATAVIGGLVVILGILAAAYLATKTAWELFKAALTAGAEIEQIRTRLELLTGSAEKATQILNTMTDFVAKAGGQFGITLAATTDFAGRMLSLGKSIETVNGLTQGLGEIAAETNGNFSELASTILRATIMLQRNADAGGASLGVSRLFNQVAMSGIPIYAKLAEQYGISTKAATLMAQAGEVSATTLENVIIKIGQQGNALAVMGNTTFGVLGTIQQKWKEVLAAFGEPVDVALTKIFRDVIPLEDQLITKAKELGDIFASFVTQMLTAWQTGHLMELMEVDFKAMFLVVVKFFSDIFGDAINEKLAIARATLDQFRYGGGINPVPGSQLGVPPSFFASQATQDKYIVERAGEIMATMTKPFSESLDAATKANEELRKSIEALIAQEAQAKQIEKGVGSPGTVPPILSGQGLAMPGTNPEEYAANLMKTPPGGIPAATPVTPSVAEQTIAAFNEAASHLADQSELVKIGEDVKKIWDSGASAADKQLDIFNLILESAGKLKHPLEDQLAVLKLITDEVQKQQVKVALAYADRMDKEKAWEAQAKIGTLSLGDTFHLGIMKMTDSWGTLQEQMVKGIAEIGNALVSDISTGLTDILDGTKTLAQGFRDMALAIVKSIEQIIIKMLVQLAIQEALSALTGGYTTVIGGQLTQVKYALPVSQQTGGLVPGNGSGDHVPILGEPGEFMVRKSSAQAFGYDKLERINKMQFGGFVRMNGGGSVDDDSSLHPSWPNDIIPLPTSDGEVNYYSPTTGDTYSADGGGINYYDIPPDTTSPDVNLNLPPFGGTTAGGGDGGGSGGIPTSGFEPTYTEPSYTDGTGITYDDTGNAPTSGGGGGYGDGAIDVSDVPGMYGLDLPSGSSNFSADAVARTFPLPGGTFGLGSFSGGSLASLGGVFYRHWLRQMNKGIFTSKGDFGLMHQSMPGVNLGSWQAFHASQVAASSMIQSNPSLFGGGGGGGGQGMGSVMGAGAIHAGQHLQIQHEGGIVRPLHEGGIVSPWLAMAAGGTVAAGEGVFTPDQMAALGPSNSSNTNQINVNINNMGGQTSAGMSGGGLNDKDAKQLASMILTVCQSQIEKQKRVGGSLYVPRSQSGR